MSQAKINELQKRQKKMLDEVKRARRALEKQSEVVKKKEAECKRIESDLISEVLIENDMTVQDLVDFLKKDSKQTPANQSNEYKGTTTDATPLGGA